MSNNGITKDSLGRLRKNGKVYSDDPRINVMRLTKDEKEYILKLRNSRLKTERIKCIACLRDNTNSAIHFDCFQAFMPK